MGLTLMISRIIVFQILFFCYIQCGWTHNLAPSLLSMQETTENHFSVTWKTPRFTSVPVLLEPILPSTCNAVDSRKWRYEGTGVRIDWFVLCEAALHGQIVGMKGLEENQSTALIRIRWRNGDIAQDLLSATNPVMRISGKISGAEVAVKYISLGIEHILGGPDHLLFVLGLLLLVREWRYLLATITAFTIGHSITLVMVSLNIIEYPVALIEFLIALSIFVIAVELSREADGRHWLRKYPWYAAGGFGLLHGMGFAGALREVGLPTNELMLALFSFNVGIECGQLMFVSVIFLLLYGASRFHLTERYQFKWLVTYLIGCTSAYWCFDRISMLRV